MKRIYNHRSTSILRTLGALSYPTTDVYLLTDALEHFHEIRLNYHELDPAYYITLPSFASCSFLAMSGVRLQQIHNRDMYERI